MQIINYILDFAIGFILMVFILRVWLQLVRADFYNPLSQFVVKISNPVVIPMRRIIPGLGGIDLATVLLAYLIASSKFMIIPLLNGGGLHLFAAFYLGLLFLVKQTGVLLFMIMLIMAIMSWVVQGYHPTHALFSQLTEPFLRPIRKIIPAIGGLDLSVLIAFVLLNVLNMFIGGILPDWRYI